MKAIWLLAILLLSGCASASVTVKADMQGNMQNVDESTGSFSVSYTQVLH